MSAILIGGLDRLKRKYEAEAAKRGVNLKVFTGKENAVAKHLGKTDMVILFTDKVSHKARRQAASLAKSRNIPLAQTHSSSVSSLGRVLADCRISP
ncbi:DUF2325 domain-containing protein [Desulfovibrio inopinatus]|uniref:DUF2325 domain-containing protein n=1 Tax=Desulfovibrio inopinatus TaxID=102109 RepID=UPI000412EB0C|nr:DUF2325 domain-containing protein [Desulfovibrio inopinatus]